MDTVIVEMKSIKVGELNYNARERTTRDRLLEIMYQINTRSQLLKRTNSLLPRVNKRK